MLGWENPSKENSKKSLDLPFIFAYQFNQTFMLHKINKFTCLKTLSWYFIDRQRQHYILRSSGAVIGWQAETALYISFICWWTETALYYAVIDW